MKVFLDREIIEDGFVSEKQVENMVNRIIKSNLLNINEYQIISISGLGLTMLTYHDI